MKKPRFSGVIVVYHLPCGHTSATVEQCGIACVPTGDMSSGIIALEVVLGADPATVDTSYILKTVSCRRNTGVYIIEITSCIVPRRTASDWYEFNSGNLETVPTTFQIP